ncbi:MAG: addiction module protein [Candidatus Firestonebacteria bacterium]
MSLALKEKALKLPLKERAKLAEHLIRSIENTNNLENECLWVKEAGRRYQEYKKGNIKSKPAEEVLKSVLKRIK